MIVNSADILVQDESGFFAPYRKIKLLIVRFVSFTNGNYGLDFIVRQRRVCRFKTIKDILNCANRFMLHVNDYNTKPFFSQLAFAYADLCVISRVSMAGCSPESMLWAMRICDSDICFANSTNFSKGSIGVMSIISLLSRELRLE